MSFAEIIILGLTLWGEARNQDVTGQVAIAHVIRNRVQMNNSNYITEVLKPKQFSFYNNKRDVWEAIKTMNKVDRRALYKTMRVARKFALNEYNDITQGATHYHADYVTPSWSKRMLKIRKIGKHIFYKRKRVL